MRRLDLAAAAAAALCLCGVAMAKPQAITKLEVVGNHAGRMMKLAVDGVVVFEGRGHLDPPGVTWTLDIQPGDGPAKLMLEIEPCEKSFGLALPRDGQTYALIIQGCAVELAS
jgi:hypothetical protein